MLHVELDAVVGHGRSIARVCPGHNLPGLVKLGMVCERCCEEFSGKRAGTRFCSGFCRRKAWAKANPERAMAPKRKWAAEHAAEILEERRLWRAENRESIRAKWQTWRERNAQRCRERSRAWAATNREHLREKSRRDYRADPERARVRLQNWRVANRGKANAQARRRRARILNAHGSHTDHEFDLIVKKQRGRCADCGRKAKLTADHTYPISRGGCDFAYNLRGLCGSCNSSKCAKFMPYVTPSLFDANPEDLARSSIANPPRNRPLALLKLAEA
jgi:hypothetical protein